jgi:hypothetical protein
MKVELPLAEVIDKITILRIKAARIEDPARLHNVREELRTLEATWAAESAVQLADLEGMAELLGVNERLWDVEDALRLLERAQRFDAEFVALARSVYVLNDERAAWKRRINDRLGSRLVEEKSYQPYR